MFQVPSSHVCLLKPSLGVESTGKTKTAGANFTATSDVNFVLHLNPTRLVPKAHRVLWGSHDTHLVLALE